MTWQRGLPKTRLVSVAEEARNVGGVKLVDDVAPDGRAGEEAEVSLHQRMLNEIEAALCSEEPAAMCAHVKLATDYARQLRVDRSLLKSGIRRLR